MYENCLGINLPFRNKQVDITCGKNFTVFKKVSQ